MNPPLNVLIAESHPHTAAETEAVLLDAGHRTDRCYDPDGKGFPCKGLLEPDGCPIDRGIDVLLLARRRVAPTPTSLENGVICAIRAGVPVTEQGSVALDPFEPWITSRFDRTADAIDACEQAVAQATEPLTHDILQRVTKVVTRADASADETVRCALERQGSRLVVRLSGPAVDKRLRQAAAIEVMTAVRLAGTLADPLDVSYRVATRHPAR